MEIATVEFPNALIFGAFLVLVRILACVVTAPILGHSKVPLLVRLGLAVILSVVAVPVLAANGRFLPLGESIGFTAVLNEALIGAAIGLGISILLSAAQVCGQVIGQLAGINLVDPLAGEGQQAGVTASFFGILSLAIFALMGGPELIVGALLETFDTVPLGQQISQSDWLQMTGTLLGQSLSLAVRAIGPAVASLLIATLTLGFISRTVPQLNMIQVGLASNLVVFWLAMFLTLGGCVWLFVEDIEGAIDFVRTNLVQQSASLDV